MKKYIVLLLILVMFGCGTKKKVVQVATVKKDVTITQHNDITTNAVEIKTTTKTTYTPKDPTKPMVLPDGTTTTNAVVEKTQETQETTTAAQDKTITETKDETKTKDRAMDLDVKKSNPYLWLYIAIATVVLFVLVYWYITKPKKPTI